MATPIRARGHEHKHKHKHNGGEMVCCSHASPPASLGFQAVPVRPGITPNWPPASCTLVPGCVGACLPACYALGPMPTPTVTSQPCNIRYWRGEPGTPRLVRELRFILSLLLVLVPGRGARKARRHGISASDTAPVLHGPPGSTELLLSDHGAIRSGCDPESFACSACVGQRSDH
ncbi:hypothetical protein VDGL01_06362 [Verticillium dahliae]